MLYEGWKPTRPENPNFLCANCHSNEIYYKAWENRLGITEDVNYHCHNCGRSWWKYDV